VRELVKAFAGLAGAVFTMDAMQTQSPMEYEQALHQKAA
jgi:hypothetical protein